MPTNISQKTKGGGYADARGATSKRKETSETSEKTKGGGYADAKSATSTKKQEKRLKSAEKTRKP